MDKFGSFLLGMLAGTIITAVEIIIAYSIISPPAALDVYQGKTTLEIIYKDGIPCDSVVVWKE